MKIIAQWFDRGCDFDKGVYIYESLRNTKSKVLRSLSKGKTSYNKALLIKELRLYNDIPLVPKKSPKPKKRPIVSHQETKIKPVIDYNTLTNFKNEGLKIEYGTVKYAHLPKELKPRFRELGQIFYQMCDLKFILNDLPAKSEKEALAVILQIEELDDQRKLIWSEIDHWRKHKSLLPTEADKFNDMNSDELRTAKARIASSKTKLEQRINKKYETLFETIDLNKKIKLEESIRRSESRLHKHELNTKKINQLL